MKVVVTISFFFLWCNALVAQTVLEQQLEALSEVLEDELEDDTYLQQLSYFQRHPLNINSAGVEDLQVFKWLTPPQVQSLVSYRNVLGPFIDLHELQAVPYWDLQTIRRLLPFITISVVSAGSFKKQLTGGNGMLLARYSRILQSQKGYNENAANRYAGDPSKILLRYKYQYGNNMQYGMTAEKDAGEKALKTFQNSFDFLSFHFYTRSKGLIKAVAVGDYTINLGQGLVHWQSLAFKKSSEVAGIVRQSAIIRPYSGAGEFYFNRGSAITLQQRRWQATMFASARSLSANTGIDSSGTAIITSFNSTGLHRTRAEMEDKKSVKHWSYGGNITYQTARFKIGLNAVQQHFSKPLQKRPEWYNLFAIKGKSWANASVDYTYTYRNIFLFGEGAVDQKGAKGFVQGLLASVDPKVDLALYYRNISPAYQSLYGNAFTENALPTNENGLYMGIAIQPNPAWRLQAYADHFNFPWVRFRADAPARGKDYLLQLHYTPNKAVEAYLRFRSETKSLNQRDDGVMNGLVPRPRQNVRLHLAWQASRQLAWRGRVEQVWYGTAAAKEKGFLVYTEAIYKPTRQVAGGLRLQYFNTDGFDSRIYVYESDVLYGYSIPFFSDNGFRMYGNLNYDLSQKWTAWLRWAETVYTDRTTIGTGTEQINGRRKTEVKVQVRYAF